MKMIEIYILTYLIQKIYSLHYSPRIKNAQSQICHHLPIEIEFGRVDMSLANFPGWRLVYQVHHSVQLWWLRNGHHFQCTFYEVRVLKKIIPWKHKNCENWKIIMIKFLREITIMNPLKWQPIIYFVQMIVIIGNVNWRLKCRSILTKSCPCSWSCNDHENIYF